MHDPTPVPHRTLREVGRLWKFKKHKVDDWISTGEAAEKGQE